MGALLEVSAGVVLDAPKHVQDIESSAIATPTAHVMNCAKVREHTSAISTRIAAWTSRFKGRWAVDQGRLTMVVKPQQCWSVRLSEATMVLIGILVPVGRSTVRPA